MIRKNPSPRKPAIIVLVSLVSVGAIWLHSNPVGRFGWCCFACTTYNSIPRPVADLQVRADGATRTVAKTHSLGAGLLKWLVESQPEVLIVATGWDGRVQVEAAVRQNTGCEVLVLSNREAIEAFNRLRNAGRRVAIHYHSTC